MSIAYFSALATEELNDTFEEISARTIPIIDAVNDLRYYAARSISHATELALIVSPGYSGAEPTHIRHAELELEETLAGYRAAVSRYRTLAAHRTGTQHRNVMTMILATAKTLQQLLQGLIAVGDSGVSGGALFVRMEEIEAYELTFLYAVDAALAAEIEQLNADRQRLHEAISMTRNVAVIFGPASVIFAVIITMHFSRRITSFLQTLKNASLAVASGNWNIRVPLMAKGEFKDVIQTFNDMASSLHSKAADVNSVKAYCHEILDTLSEMVIVTGLDGKITTVNSATLSQLGYLEDELIGRAVADIVASEYRDAVRNAWLPMLIKGGNIPNKTIVILHKGKREIPVIFSVSSMLGSGGIVDGIVFKAVVKPDIGAESQHEA